jgi:clan AA aspartic protease (TIGR02281 family)
MRDLAFSILAILFLLPFNNFGQEIIKLKKSGGVYLIPCTVNDLPLNFIFDTGASDVSISITEAMFMLKNGFLETSEIKESVKYNIANGEIAEGTRINLKTIQVGNQVLHNIEASIIHSTQAPLLFGQTAMEKLGTYTFDYSNATLTLNNSNSKKTEIVQNNTSPDLFDMISVTGGDFFMGSDSGNDDEQPIHRVNLDSFSIGKYEVTQDQWLKVMGENPSVTKCANCPVTNVSWNEIQTFLDKLNALTKKKYRLPTEAEWEYASRGGQKHHLNVTNGNYIYWNKLNSDWHAHAVGTSSPNSLGLYDMLGNVSEWCQDFYAPYPSYYFKNPAELKNGQFKILRGGNFTIEPRYCSETNRSKNNPIGSDYAWGFRIVLPNN